MYILPNEIIEKITAKENEVPVRLKIIFLMHWLEAVEINHDLGLSESGSPSLQVATNLFALSLCLSVPCRFFFGLGAAEHYFH